MLRQTKSFWTLAILSAQLGFSPPATSDEIAGEGVDFERLYNIVLSEPVNHEFVYTEGKNTPLYEAMAVPNYYVGDLNDNNCDDLLLDYSDSLGIPQVFFGNKEMEFTPTIPFIGDARVRTIRRAQFADINNDGRTDFVGFPLEEPYRYCCGGSSVYKSRGKVDWSSGGLTESYYMDVHIYYSDEESKIVMEGRFMNTEHQFEDDFSSEWPEIQKQCNPNMTGFTLTLNDRFGSMTSELACQIQNIKSDRVSRYFQSLVMYVNQLEIPK